MVRINSYNSINRRLDTTRNIRDVNQRIIVLCNITVNCKRRISNGIQCSTRNNLTISVPCVSTTSGYVSSKSNLTAFANHITRSEGQHNRIKGNDSNCIVTDGLALRCGLINTYLVIGGFIRINRKCTARRTKYRSICCSIGSIPSIGEVF